MYLDAGENAFGLKSILVTIKVWNADGYGPVPKHVLETVSLLQASGAMCVRDTEYFGYAKKEYLPMRKPDLSGFTADEISIVDDYHKHRLQ